MSLTYDELSHIAKLSSLHFSDSEKEKFLWQIDEIIWFVSKLQELDVDWIEPLYHPIEDNYMDLQSWDHNSDLNEKFVNNVKHDVKNNWIVIKSAIK